jgi:MFS family permease
LKEPHSLTAQKPLRRYRAFVVLWFMRLASTGGYQMLAVAIGWQIYALTGSALDLGFVGLIQFIPSVVLTLLIGHAADRYDKRLILRIAQMVYAICAFTVLSGFWFGWLTRELLFGVVFMLGTSRAFELPTAHALVPALVPTEVLSRATAAWAASNQSAAIAGPAIGGLLYALSPTLTCAVCGLLFLAAAIMTALVTYTREPPSRDRPSFASVFAGYYFIRQRPRLLGVITLDLFVVLLGGATALLPVFARDILETGPAGLGLLRSAPAVGALLTMLWLTRHPIERRIGPALFAVVALFGVATTIFGLSTWFPLSLAALAILGASDAVSVVLRFTLVQIETPEAMRGRVSAINYLFVNASNTLGEFESGAVAAWLGAVTSVVIGGIGSVLVAGLWMALFPQLLKVDRFEPPKEKE